ncbi:MAG: Glutamate synthase (NADPH) small chain [Syntrophorhabdaceae bacterium PtaU1.Bin034]|nr:MAG: Glutamate synthase (NADPH) small chain [Syntrophorhabdaceae bacterium PtaU1.Bin034]
MKDFAHRNATSVDEAVRLLKKNKGKTKLNAGGTDLLGLLKDMVLPDYPETLINVKDIAGLDYIREDKEGLRIGALTKLKHLVDSPVVREGYRLLAEAAKSVAGPQIRNMATIGGNLAQDVRCWYYRYPDQIGGTIKCLRKGGTVCNALAGENRYHSIFGAAPLASHPCAAHCPANTAIPSYLEKIKNADFNGAARIFVEFNPMPAITGRVCPVFCEPNCNRTDHDEPVAIKCVERSLGDYTLDHAKEIYKGPEAESGKRVAIVGSGPAGLAAAYYLRRAGHAVTVYEKLPEAGGMLRYSIPGYRLPKDVLKKQVQALADMGITFTCGTEAGKIDELRDRFDAVLVATGAWKERAQTLKGDGSAISGLTFLKKVSEGDRTVPGKKVAVIGGGNVAVDVARTLARLGAKPVVIYRRTQKEMPAFKDEIEKAREEGTVFQYLTLPVRSEKSGEKVLLTCVKTKLGSADASRRRRPVPKEGSDFTASYDAVITATGEEPDRSLLSGKINKDSGYLLGDNLYIAGDFKNGSTTVIEAMTSGREAARVINSRIGAKEPSQKTVSSLPRFTSPVYERSSRLAIGEAAVAERVKDVDLEDCRGASLLEAEKEARRCFDCGCLAINPSDVGNALVALRGTIVTTKRSIGAETFFAPNATASTVLEADEMITEIRIPSLPKGARQKYLKFTLRKPIDFALVSVASVLQMANGTCKDARIVLGAVAPGPIRAKKAEEIIIGKPITAELIEEAAEAAVAESRPLSKNGYKVQIGRALVKKTLEEGSGVHDKNLS